MQLQEILHFPVTYQIIIGFSISMFYVLARQVFRKYKTRILILSIVIGLVGAGVAFLGSDFEMYVVLFLVPLYATLVIWKIEEKYLEKYNKHLPDTAFWYFTDEENSGIDNAWNLVIHLMIIVLPLIVFMISVIFMN